MTVSWTGNEGTDVYYNGVWLRNVATRGFDQSIEYDESGTDRMFTRFTISVEALVHDDVTQWQDCIGTVFERGAFNSLNAQAKMSAIHGLLSVPRQQFEYWQAGTLLLAGNGQTIQSSQSEPPAWHRTTDLDNGPKPRDVSINAVIAERCYRVSFTIEVCLLICGDIGIPSVPSNTPNGKPHALDNRRLLSNRFVIEENRDGNFYMTRTMTGRARVAHVNLWSEAIRYLVLPGLPRGYKRENVNFVTSANGLDLAYRVVDRQTYAAAPYPATNFKGNHTEATGVNGANSEGHVAVRCFGSPATDKKSLLLCCLAVAESRIGQLGKIAEMETNVIANHIQITDVLDENVVELAVSFMRFGLDQASPEARWMNVMFSKLGLLPSVERLLGDTVNREDGTQYNRDQFLRPYPWDDGAPYGIFAQYLQDGCYPWHYTPEGAPPFSVGDYSEVEQKEPNNSSSKKVYKGEDASFAEPPPASSLHQRSAAQMEAPYTYLTVKSDYPMDFGILALPKATDDLEINDSDNLICKIHATTCKKNVFVTAKRVGKAPVIPAYQTSYTDNNGIFYALDELHPEFGAPTLMPDGINYEYECNIRLVYKMSRGLKPTDKISFGSLPWDITTKADHMADLSESNQDEEMV